MGRQLTISMSGSRILPRLLVALHLNTVRLGGRLLYRYARGLQDWRHSQRLLLIGHKLVFTTEALGSAIRAGIKLQQQIGPAAEYTARGARSAQHIYDGIHVRRLRIEDGQCVQLTAAADHWRQLQLLEEQLHTAVRAANELVRALDVRRIVGRKTRRVEVALAQIPLDSGAGKEIEIAETVRHQSTVRLEELCVQAWNERGEHKFVCLLIDFTFAHLA